MSKFVIPILFTLLGVDFRKSIFSDKSMTQGLSRGLSKFTNEIIGLSGLSG